MANTIYSVLESSSSSDEKSDKRVLCYSVLTKKSCNYGSICSYAHSLDDQRVSPIRERAYDMIRKDISLKKVDLIKDQDVYYSLMSLTKLCQACVKNTCAGGYNCKHGVFDPKFQICSDDLATGHCRYKNCRRVHLTGKGLIPYDAQKNIQDEENRVSTRKFRRLNNKELEDGVLLTDSFMKSFVINSDSDSYSETDFEIDRNIRYLNSDSDDDIDESIFIE